MENWRREGRKEAKRAVQYQDIYTYTPLDCLWGRRSTGATGRQAGRQAEHRIRRLFVLAALIYYKTATARAPPGFLVINVITTTTVLYLLARQVPTDIRSSGLCRSGLCKNNLIGAHITKLSPRREPVAGTLSGTYDAASVRDLYVKRHKRQTMSALPNRLLQVRSSYYR